jgi:hypothetical protein
MFSTQRHNVHSIHLILACTISKVVCDSLGEAFCFTFTLFFRSAKKAELEENQRSYKQKKKRRRIKVQEDSSSENKAGMSFIVCFYYNSHIISLNFIQELYLI